MSPGVQCDDGVMTFTASGKQVKQLFVDRGKGTPDEAGSAVCGRLLMEEKTSWCNGCLQVRKWPTVLEQAFKSPV